MHDTPENTILYKDENGRNRTQQWNYRSVIGMMSYLESTSHSDILFAIH